MSVTIEIEGLQAGLYNLQKLESAAFGEAAKKSLQGAGKVLEKALHWNIGLIDHTLQDLADMGHPYARRHRSIKIHAEKPYQVHAQSRKMRNNITGEITGSGKKIGYRVGFNYGAVGYAKFVIQGTRVMLPRNTIYLTAQEPEVQKDMMRAVVRVLGKELRTGAGVRFA